MAIPLFTGERTEKESELLDKRYKQVIDALQKAAPEGAIIPEKIQAAREKERALRESDGALAPAGLLDPIEFLPDVMGVGAVGAALGSMAMKKGAAKEIPELLAKKDPQGFYSVLENLFKSKAGKTVTPEELTGIAKGAKATEVEQAGLASIPYEGVTGAPYIRKKIPTSEVIERIEKTKPRLQITELVNPTPDKTSPYYVKELEKVLTEWSGQGPLDSFIANEGALYRALQKKDPKLVEDLNWAENVVKSVFKLDENSYLPKWQHYTIPGGSKYKETLIQLPDITPRFSSDPHYPFKPNIVGWARTDMRPDSEGKQVLFVQEIQSDWAKKARRRGTFDPNIEKDISEKNKYIDALREELEKAVKSATTYEEADKLYKKFYKEENIISNEIRKLQDDLWNKVPRTPYTEPEAYIDLVLKNLIQQAVRDKADKIAIIPGKLIGELYPDQGEKELKALIDFYDQKIVQRLKKTSNAFGGKVGESIVSIDPKIPSLEGLGSPVIEAALKKGLATKAISLEITDEIKKNVERGLPIIAAGGVALPTLIKEYKKQDQGQSNER